ncbi:MAG: biotin/lipoyl-containing protein, partial [Candidatus Neomarinimicrobiota bacterium]|nr:biotin/lipoyl-containing protein [Candidatus Neomarinimicrobiota bacterium]
MIKDIILPNLGEGIDSAEISEVVVKKGCIVNPDDIILVLESEKASMEIPAEVSGEIKDVMVKTGEEVVTG